MVQDRELSFVALDLAWYTGEYEHSKMLAPCGQCIVARTGGSCSPLVLEQITLDRDTLHDKDVILHHRAELVSPGQ